MRQGQQNNRNNRQQRGRGRRQNNNSGSGGGGNPSNKVYDSNGPDVRVRGSAQTVADKYLQLAGDASAQGDQIKTESYFQYAEHYLRIVAENQAVKEQRQAEKDKVAEEHAVRMQAKKEKATAELERKAAIASANLENSSPADNNAESDDSPENGKDDWGGHQPAFLQREDEEKPEKPKKPRRKPAKKKAVAKADDDTASVEAATAPESEAEAPSAS